MALLRAMDASVKLLSAPSHSFIHHLAKYFHVLS